MRISSCTESRLWNHFTKTRNLVQYYNIYLINRFYQFLQWTFPIKMKTCFIKHPCHGLTTNPGILYFLIIFQSCLQHSVFALWYFRHVCIFLYFSSVLAFDIWAFFFLCKGLNLGIPELKNLCWFGCDISATFCISSSCLLTF